jgi:hypothetical protein
MEHVESTDIVLDEISIIEWYDGIVIATGRQQQNTYLIVLVAWDMEQSRKVFLLLGVERSVETEINRSIETNNWEEFKRIFNDVVTHYKGHVFLTFEEPTVGTTLSLTRSTTNDLASLREHEVENALTPESLNRWLGPQVP